MKNSWFIVLAAGLAAGAAFGVETNINISANATFALPDGITKITKEGAGNATFTTATLPSGGSKWTVKGGLLIPQAFDMAGQTLTEVGTASDPWNTTIGVQFDSGTTISNPGDIVILTKGSILIRGNANYPSTFGNHTIDISHQSQLGLLNVTKPIPYDVRAIGTSTETTLATWGGAGWGANPISGRITIPEYNGKLRAWARSYTDMTFLNSVTGAGRLYKTGQGRLIITGNTESAVGSLAIDRGGLVLSDGASFSVTNGSTLLIGYYYYNRNDIVNSDSAASLSVGDGARFLVPLKSGGKKNPLLIACNGESTGGTSGYMDVLDGATVVSDLEIANALSYSVGAVRQLGGEVNGVSSYISMAGVANSYGCYYMEGGEMHSVTEKAVTMGRGYGICLIKGGYFEPKYSFHLGQNGGHGEVYVKNAVCTNQYSYCSGNGVTSSQQALEDKSSTFTVDEGASAYGYAFTVQARHEYTSSLNVRNGGVFNAMVIAKEDAVPDNVGSMLYVNSDGGTLYSTGGTHWNKYNEKSGKPGERLTVYGGGVTICQAGKKYWDMPIVKPTGKGVKSITLPSEVLNGDVWVGGVKKWLPNRYLGPAKLLITNKGNGRGATALCDFEPVLASGKGATSNQTGAGRTTGAIVTNPGWDYESADDIECRVYYAQHWYTNWTCAVTLADNVQTGGVTKTGIGELVMRCANSYGGATRVLEGEMTAEVEGVFPQTTDIEVAAGAKVKLGGFDTTVNGVGGGGTITSDGAKLTVNRLNVKMSEASSGYRLYVTGRLTFAKDAKIVITDYNESMADAPAVECAVVGDSFEMPVGYDVSEIPVVDANGDPIDGWVARKVGNYTLKVGKVRGTMVIFR